VYGIQQEYVIHYQLVNVKKTIPYSHHHRPRWTKNKNLKTHNLMYRRMKCLSQVNIKYTNSIIYLVGTHILLVKCMREKQNGKTDSNKLVEWNRQQNHAQMNNSIFSLRKVWKKNVVTKSFKKVHAHFVFCIIINYDKVFV